MKKFSRSITRSAARMGDDIRTARIRRRLSQKDFAMNMGVSIGTVQRIEAGDPGVSFGNIAMAFLVLNNLTKLESVLTPSIDEIGATMDRAFLPQRVRSSRLPKTANVATTEDSEVIAF